MYNDLVFREITQTVEDVKWQPEPGDTLTGRYLKSEQGKGKGQNLMFHHIMDELDQDVSILGGAVLDRLLKKVEPGDIVRIVYQGMKPGLNGNDYKDYKLYVAEQ